MCREGKVEMQYTKMDRGNKRKSQGNRRVGQEKEKGGASTYLRRRQQG